MKKSSLIERVSILLEIFLVSLKLGFISFGGPIAHLSYFHMEYVQKRKWMNEQSYADLVAVSQVLPGPASSQVGFGVGVMRGGILGGILSFIGFMFPSVVALICLALVWNNYSVSDTGLIHGLKIVAVVVVSHAVISMAKTLTPDLKRKTVALIALVITLVWPVAYIQIGVNIAASLWGYTAFKNERLHAGNYLDFPVSKKTGSICLVIFAALLFLLPIIRENTSSNYVAMFDSFYRAGSLVFGGGHVVLPLLQSEFVPTGWISEASFLAGYGSVQAVPGPLFTFAAYIGAVINGWQGGIISTIAIFLPGFLVVIGALPFWKELRKNPKVQGGLLGVNAAVVGLLLSAFYDPIWTTTITNSIDFSFAAVLFCLLVYWKTPPWFIVILGSVGGMALL